MRKQLVAILALVGAIGLSFVDPALGQRNLKAQEKSSFSEDNRVALVVGNATYPTSPLRNPVNDARAITEHLQKLGFTVIKRENLKAREIGAALREFRSRLSAGSTALVFYAGHGLQVNGVNYLPAVDANIESEEDVPTQALNLSQILELMEAAKTRVNLVLLDACRNNPFSRRFRSVAGGLAKVDAPSGTLISFATRPGSVAADGDGKNGLYTEHLLRHMNEPGLPIEQVLKRVGAGVKLASKGRQEPWMEGLIEGEFFFSPPTLAASSAPAPVAVRIQTSDEIDQEHWNAIKDSRVAKDFEDYLANYPSGRFRALASARLRSLAVAGPAASAPPSAAPSSLPQQSAIGAAYRCTSEDFVRAAQDDDRESTRPGWKPQRWLDLCVKCGGTVSGGRCEGVRFGGS